MNATLQCLLHISELNLYFLNEYPNDMKSLNQKNNYVQSKGNISNAYYEVVKGVQSSHSKNIINTNYYGSYSPGSFKKILGKYNLQFSLYEANDSKDLILYLLQTFHEELNYFGGQMNPNFNLPNQLDRVNTFTYFMNTYNFQNFSIISKLFFGTYENMTKCCECKSIFYSYQKFEFISFSTFSYRNSIFNIYDGFKDNQKIQYLRGNNQYYCNICNNLCDGEICCKIIQPPNKLVINIDYGRDKMFDVNKLIFDEIIDITDYINFNFGKKIKYSICGVCTHLGYSGSSGHYIAYCRNSKNGQWYNFNDSTCKACSKDEIYRGSPYLLLYEQIL